MDTYVGLDVSLEKTSICVVDGSGRVLKEGEVAADPGEIGRFIEACAPSVHRIGLEAGPT